MFDPASPPPVFVQGQNQGVSSFPHLLWSLGQLLAGTRQRVGGSLRRLLRIPSSNIVFSVWMATVHPTPTPTPPTLYGGNQPSSLYLSPVFVLHLLAPEPGGSSLGDETSRPVYAPYVPSEVKYWNDECPKLCCILETKQALTHPDFCLGGSRSRDPSSLRGAPSRPGSC